MTIKLHIKNNHAGPDTFPSTPESEPVFTISMEKYRHTAAQFPGLAGPRSRRARHLGVLPLIESKQSYSNNQ
ncbi:MAG: hypothetical protein GY783_08705 [Gammaproteobacteria bacterium]|nr:hypothetical protein [Gammaproteobacteria bacterium]